MKNEMDEAMTNDNLINSFDFHSLLFLPSIVCAFVEFYVIRIRILVHVSR